MPELDTLHAVVRSSSASFRLATLLVAALATGCPEGEDGGGKATAGDAVIDAAPAKKEGKHANMKPEEIEYEGTRLGLEILMRDLRTAIPADDQPEITVLLASLRLQDDEAWFKKTFGAKLGAKLSADYKPHKEEIGVLAEHLKEQFKEGLTKIQVDRFQTANVATSTGYQSEALKKMVEKVALFSVRLVSEDGKRMFHLWSFVHHEDSFRYIGKLQGVAEKRKLGDRDLNEYRLADAERLVAQDK
jgi:hypothetical protein